MAITRRVWLKGTTAASAMAFLPVGVGCGGDDPSPVILPLGDQTVFKQGVSSGDPLADRVILWTRVDGATGPVTVDYEVSTSVHFSGTVTTGSVMTDATKDYTVKVDATGLSAGTTYFYRFTSNGSYSDVGRTKTTPTGGVSHLRFGMVSCSNFGFGYFHAYKRLAERDDLDAILHLGDYIYEFGNGGDYPKPSLQVRPWEPANEIITLDDYRTRYKQYRTDQGLRAAHAKHVWMTTWDDHEIANDTWLNGAQNHDPLTEGPFAARKAAASQAMHEYLPLRGTPADPMYRSFRYGDLAEIVFLDTRDEGRDEQILSVVDDNPSRHLISATQEAWLGDTLAASTSQWKILAQQVMVAPFTLDGTTKAPFFLDQWDGYRFARDRLYDILDSKGGADVVVLTGDIHGSFAAELPRDPWAASYDPATGAGSMAVEFVCPGVTSPGFPGGIFDQTILDACPHMKYVDWTYNGYVVLDLKPSRIQADWYFVDGIAENQGAEFWAKGFYANTGDSHLIEATKRSR